MATVDPAIARGPVLDALTTDAYMRRGMALAGMARGDLGCLTQDFALANAINPPGWVSNATSSGTHTRVLTATDGAIIQYSTGATANSTGGIYTEPNLISNARTKKWYAAFRAGINSTPDSVTRWNVGLADMTAGSNAALIGVQGAVDTTNYRMLYDGYVNGSGSPGTVDTGVAITTGLRVFELYGRGDNIFRARIDGGTELTATMAEALTDCNLTMDIRNGATAAAQTFRVDWLVAVFGR